MEEAEHAYREAARTHESYGNRVAAAQSWDQLGQVMLLAGRPDDAEAWFVKALTTARAEGARSSEAASLSNVAAFLVDRAGRLGDARAYAEQALAICRELDPAVPGPSPSAQPGT